MRPNRSTAARTAASASARLVTSSFTGSRSFDCPKALDTRSVSRPDATTEWPAARAALAKSAPIPRPAPVMNQIFLPTTSPRSQTRDPRSRLFGRHHPEFRNRGVSRPGHHEGDAVRDILGFELVGSFVERHEDLGLHPVIVVRLQLRIHGAWLEHADPHVLPGDFLSERLREAIHAELGEV